MSRASLATSSKAQNSSTRSWTAPSSELKTTSLEQGTAQSTPRPATVRKITSLRHAVRPQASIALSIWLPDVRPRKSNAVKIPEQPSRKKQSGSANPLVIEILTEQGALMGQKRSRTPYPHCWRCHNATIFRATDHGSSKGLMTCANVHFAAIKIVRWMPEGRNPHLQHGVQPPRLVHLARAWGVPIVVFYDDKAIDGSQKFWIALSNLRNAPYRYLAMKRRQRNDSARYSVREVQRDRVQQRK